MNETFNPEYAECKNCGREIYKLFGQVLGNHQTYCWYHSDGGSAGCEKGNRSPVAEPKRRTVRRRKPSSVIIKPEAMADTPSELKKVDAMAVRNQAPPKIVKGRAISDLVRSDIEARAREGESKYGTRLKAHNGRDALVDLYQELLDASCYIRQVIEERGDKTWNIQKQKDAAVLGAASEGNAPGVTNGASPWVRFSERRPVVFPIEVVNMELPEDAREIFRYNHAANMPDKHGYTHHRRADNTFPKPDKSPEELAFEEWYWKTWPNNGLRHMLPDCHEMLAKTAWNAAMSFKKGE